MHYLPLLASLALVAHFCAATNRTTRNVDDMMHLEKEMLLAGGDLSQLATYFQRGSYQTTSLRLTNGNVAWYPLGITDQSAPVYVYVCGSLMPPSQYAATLDLVASWGVATIGVANDIAGTTCTTAASNRVVDAIIQGTLPAPLRATIDPKLIVTGGHSGGGPCALEAAAARQNNVVGTIAQHAAAIPLVNRLSDASIRRLTMPVFVVCGTADVMPFCDCGTIRKSLFDRLTTPRFMIELQGASHVLGVQGVSGRDTAGGVIVAMIRQATGNSESAQVHYARRALVPGRAGRGDKVTDKLG